MALEQRQEIIRRIEAERNGRRLVCFFNFDRASTPPISGLSTQFSSDAKEVLFRVLKETLADGEQVDLCLYTRGGDTNSVWPIVSLLREFDPEFEVLVPFRCHSGGTLLALGSRKIVMSPISELSPVDPSTGNQFNPSDPADPKNRLAISVEDTQAYRTFILDQFGIKDTDKANALREVLSSFLDRLTERVHPLALGNVHRVHQQIKKLARDLLQYHPMNGRDLDAVIVTLTTGFYSHLHMINRHEAHDILGEGKVEFASEQLASLLDELLRQYEDDFALRNSFILRAYLKDDPEKEARLIGAAVESEKWSYLYETSIIFRQHSAIPSNVQVQLPPGQAMPLIPGLPREFELDVTSQDWVHNKEPLGVTL